MSYQLAYSEQAIDDLDSLVVAIADRAGDAGAGLALMRRIIAHCDRLAGLPGVMGTGRPLIGADVRSSPDGNYLIFFRYRFEVLEILAIVDGRRDLGAYLLNGAEGDRK